jgi:hypothetical protein
MQNVQASPGGLGFSWAGFVFLFLYKNKDLAKFTKNHKKIRKISNQFC